MTRFLPWISLYLLIGALLAATWGAEFERHGIANARGTAVFMGALWPVALLDVYLAGERY